MNSSSKTNLFGTVCEDKSNWISRVSLFVRMQPQVRIFYRAIHLIVSMILKAAMERYFVNGINQFDVRSKVHDILSIQGLGPLENHVRI